MKNLLDDSFKVVLIIIFSGTIAHNLIVLVGMNTNDSKKVLGFALALLVSSVFLFLIIRSVLRKYE